MKPDIVVKLWCEHGLFYHVSPAPERVPEMRVIIVAASLFK
jgi:hypothetical protein